MRPGRSIPAYSRGEIVKNSPLKRPCGYVVFDGEDYVAKCSAGRACSIAKSVLRARIFRRKWQAQLIAQHWPNGRVVPVHRHYLTVLAGQWRAVDLMPPEAVPVQPLLL